MTPLLSLGTPQIGRAATNQNILRM
jgi:hypothetical protein